MRPLHHLRIALTCVVLLAAAPARAADFTPGGAQAVAALLAGGGSAALCERCHPDVAAQWAGSAHRQSSLDNPYYAFAFDAFREEKGLGASLFCASCHDPVLVAAGAISRPFTDEVRRSPEARAGIGCLVCHGMDDTGPLHGNGAYHVLAEREVASPRTPAHRAQLRRPLLESPRLCMPCHKVGLGSEVNGDRWIRGQDEWDAWRLAAASGNGANSVRRPPRPSRCQDCHMPFEAAPLGDAAARVRPEMAGFAPGTPLVRSHRFLGANTALPALRGDADTLERTRAFLQGSVSLDLEPAPREGLIDVVLRARRVGHRFPGGTMDSNEVWVEVEAHDGAGRLLGRSGGLDGEGRLDEAAHLVRVQPVDGAGDPIARRDVQHLHGVAWDTALGPSDPAAVRYRLPEGTARVRARLLYRKLPIEYTRAACSALGDEAARRRCRDLPVIEVAHDERLLGEGEEAARARLGEAEWLRRRLDHGLALADALVEEAGAGEALLRSVAAARPLEVEAWLGLARVATAQGRIDDAVRLARQAGTVRHDFPAALLLEARALYQGYRFEAARPPIERLAALLPEDDNVLSLLARVRGVTGDAQGALEAATRLAAQDPDLDEAHYQRAVALRELGRSDESDAAGRDYVRYRVAHEIDLDLRRRFRARHPARAAEDQPLHVHSLQAIPAAR